MTQLLKSLDDTKAFATDLAKTLTSGDWISLVGELGSGKTTFVHYLCEALGVSDEVHSPTFTLVNCYQGRQFRVIHMDLYRLDHEVDMANLDIDGYLNQDQTIVLIEWADKLTLELPEPISIQLSYVDETTRAVQIKVPE